MATAEQIQQQIETNELTVVVDADQYDEAIRDAKVRDLLKQADDAIRQAEIEDRIL